MSKLSNTADLVGLEYGDPAMFGTIMVPQLDLLTV